VAEDYVHRIGRTGRAGSEGEALSLVCVDEHKLLKDIERLLKLDLPKEVVHEFAPDPSIKPEPIEQGRRSQSRWTGRSSQSKPFAPARPVRRSPDRRDSTRSR